MTSKPWLDLVWGLGAAILLLALLPPTERALMRLARRRLDPRQRVARSLLFLVGMAAWAYGSYVSLYQLSRQWWFISFLLVALVWKLIVDVLIFGASDPPQIR